MSCIDVVYNPEDYDLTLHHHENLGLATLNLQR